MTMPCEQADNIKDIKTDIKDINGRLGDGDVTLAVLHKTQKEILEQTKKTNGRVTKLERFMAAVRWAVIGVLAFSAAQALGITEIIMKVLK